MGSGVSKPASKTNKAAIKSTRVDDPNDAEQSEKRVRSVEKFVKEVYISCSQESTYDIVTSLIESKESRWTLFIELFRSSVAKKCCD
jgi:hypothetical protein